MTIEQSEEIFDRICQSSCRDARNDLINKAIAYARIRVDHFRAGGEKQRWMNRGGIHNEFIAACNTMAEEMGDHGEDATWRRSLGQDRKVIGDFACFIHCLIGLEAR